jgi:L-malate glycosyltransferase
LTPPLSTQYPVSSTQHLKVAIIIPRLAQLGPVLMIQALVNCFSKFDDILVKVFYLDKEIDPEIKMAVPLERYSVRSLCFEEYDVIHTNGIRPDLIAFYNRNKIKYHISTIHNFVFDDLKYSYNRLISRVFGNLWLKLWRKADKLVCVSLDLKSYYNNWFATSKLEVIYNGITEPESSFACDDDLTEYIDSLHSKGLKVIGYAGILSTRKGIEQILNLIAIEATVAAIIIGFGKEFKTLLNKAVSMGISERCFFAGFRARAPKYFRHFDIFIMPSRSEGFGLALVEAVRQHVPVICSDLPVFRELFNSDEVTFFRLDDAISLKLSVLQVLESGNTKVESAYRRYKENYTDTVMAGRYLELYRTVGKP